MNNFIKPISAFFVIVLFTLFAFGCSDNSSTSDITNNVSVVDSDTKAVSETNNVIYEDDIISAEFIGFSDNIVDGMFDLSLKVNNASSENITVYIQDLRIDKSMVEVGSGVPCEIASGANRTHSFFGRLDLAGLESADNATELIFKIRVVNENFETLITTEDLTITL